MSIIIVCICAPYITYKTIVTTDEFVSIAVPYYFLGADWRDFVSNLKYHGYGATILITPLLKLYSGIYPYRLFLGEALFFRWAITIITFRLVYTYFCISPLKSSIVALLCCFGTLGNFTYSELNVLTELPLALICVCCAWYFLGCKSYFSSTLIAFILGYTVLIHARFIVIWISFFIAGWHNYKSKCYKKKMFIYTCVLLMLFGGCFYLLQSNTISVLFGTANSNVSNTLDKFTTTDRLIGYFQSLASLKMLVITENLLSLVASFTYYSFGFIWLWIFAIIAFYKDASPRLTTVDIRSISVFSLFSWLFMNFLIAVRSVDAVDAGLHKKYTYIRYAIPFTWQIVFLGTAIIFSNYHILKRIIIRAFIADLTFESYFYFKILPIISSTGYERKGGFEYLLNTELNTTSFFSILYITTKICLLAVMLVHYKGIKFFWAPYAIISAIALVNNYNTFFERSDNFYKRCDQSVNYIMENSTYLSDYNVYYYGSDFFCMCCRISLPFHELKYLNELNVISEEKSFVIVSDKQISMENIIYTEILDDGEYVYSDVILTQ